MSSEGGNSPILGITGLELQLSHWQAVVGGISSRQQMQNAQGNARGMANPHTG